MSAFRFIILTQVISGYALASHVVDHTVLRVGNNIILDSEVKAKQNTAGPFGGRPKNYEEALSRLTDELLINQLAKKNNAAATPDYIEKSIENIAEQNKLTKAQFLSALKTQGLTVEAYKKQLEGHLNKMELIRSQVAKNIKVSESEILNLYKKEYEQNNSKTSNYSLEVDQISLPKSNQSKTELKKIRELLGSGRSLGPEKTFKKLKSINTKIDILQLGQIKKGDLVDSLDAAIFSTPVGSVTKPFYNDELIEIYWVKNKSFNKPTPLEKVKKDLHNKILEKKMDDAFKRYISREKDLADIERLDGKKDS